MSTTEIAVVVGGLFLGYWIVNSFMGAKPKKKEGPQESSRQESTEDASCQGNQKTSQQEQEQRHEEEPISSSWHKILEVPPSATSETISTAYKQKIRQYHPDKVASMGPELRDLAELKSKQINAAYHYAMKLRG